MKIKIASLICIAALIASAPAIAQDMTITQNWTPTSTSPATLGATTASGNVALPGIGPTLLVCNQSASIDAFVAFGTTNAVTAATTGLWIKAAKCRVFAAVQFGVLQKYLAAITASSTATIYIESGVGTPLIE